MSDPETPAPKLTEEQSLVLGILGAKQRGKKAYGKAEGYLAKLRKLGKKTVQLSDGRKFAIVDIFAGEDMVKKMVFIDRWQLQEVK